MGLCPLTAYRYDLAPMAVTFASCCAWFSFRFGLGGGLAAVGTYMKFFPCVIVAPAAVLELAGIRPGRYRALITFSVSLLVFGVIWSLISCRGAVASVGYHLDRGLEIESIYSGAVLGLTSMTGTRPTVIYSHSCFEISGLACLTTVCGWRCSCRPRHC